MPSEFLALPQEDKDFLVASIMVKAEDDKKKMKEASKKRR